MTGTAPPAPWDLVASMILWFGRAPAAARAALQPGVRGRPLAVAGAMLSYAETPVGPYSEVMGQCALLRGRRLAGHVPFIAVDSDDSVAGGRGNWWLPKTLADFHGEAASGRMSAERDGAWAIDVRARPFGPPLPFRARFTLVQAREDASEVAASGHARLRARPALVRVGVRGPASLTAWLRPGTYPGLVAERFEGTLGAAVG